MRQRTSSAHAELIEFSLHHSDDVGGKQMNGIFARDQSWSYGTSLLLRMVALPMVADGYDS